MKIKMEEITKSETVKCPCNEDHRTQWGKKELLHKGKSRTTVFFELGKWLNSQPSIDIVTT
jgi:hypothetical protein